MLETQKFKHEVYDDRDVSKSLFMHESSFVCSRFIDDKRKERGEAHARHLWIREATDNKS